MPGLTGGKTEPGQQSPVVGQRPGYRIEERKHDIQFVRTAVKEQITAQLRQYQPVCWVAPQIRFSFGAVLCGLIDQADQNPDMLLLRFRYKPGGGFCLLAEPVRPASPLSLATL